MNSICKYNDLESTLCAITSSNLPICEVCTLIFQKRNSRLREVTYHICWDSFDCVQDSTHTSSSRRVEFVVSGNRSIQSWLQAYLYPGAQVMSPALCLSSYFCCCWLSSLPVQVRLAWIILGLPVLQCLPSLKEKVSLSQQFQQTSQERALTGQA